MMNRLRAIIRIFLPVLLAAALTFAACSPYEMVDIARIAVTGDVASAQRYAARKAMGYALNPKALARDIERFKKILGLHKKEAGRKWGEKEVEDPVPERYVKYTQNYRSRAMVDFDRGFVRVETIDQENPLTSLHNAIVTTLLTPDDPRAVDLFTAGEVRLSGRPFLFGEVLDHEGGLITGPDKAEAFARHLLARGPEERTAEVDGVDRAIRFVTIPMIPDHGHVRALKYKPLVQKYADQFKVSPNLVFAVIRIESNFNPFAVSPAGAFGLMQIVPGAAGAEVRQYLGEGDDLPSREFLFDPENNIRYGSAYLGRLFYDHLDGIDDPVSLEYCAVAAYNTGPGNLWRAFARDKDAARRLVNAKPPADVYSHLLQNLPYAETRAYLPAVMAAKKDFVAF